MTDTHTATGQPHARHTAAGAGEAYWFFDSLMVIQADQPGQPVIIEATVAPGGRPTWTARSGSRPTPASRSSARR